MSLFSWLRPRTATRRQSEPSARRTPLALEECEERLALSPIFPGNNQRPFTTDGGVLRFWDDGASTAIVITHDGSYGVNNVSIKTYDRSQYDAWQAGQRNEPPQTTDGVHSRGWVAAQLAGKSFWKVEVNDAGGNDRVVYNLPNGVRDGVYNEIDARLHGGDDALKATINGMGVGAGIRVLADGSSGNDALEVEVHGTLRSGSSLGVAMEGGYGLDDVHVDAFDSVVVETGALIWANLSGYYYNQMTQADLENVVAFWYHGRMDGRLQYNLFGGNRGDEMMVNIWANGGSRGSVGLAGTESARVQGGDGHDHIYYYVRGADLTWYQPTADGGSGTDTFHRINYGESWSFYRAITRDDGDGSRELDPNRARRLDRFQFDVG